MSDQHENPRPFATRKVGDRTWEVLIYPENRWQSIPCEDDAKQLAKTPVLRSQYLDENRRDASFADEMERTAAVFDKYDLTCAASRQLQKWARLIRAFDD